MIAAANRFNLILENHGCEPVYLESGQELGQVGRVVVCSGQDNSDNDDNVSLPSVHLLTTEQLADREDSNISVDIVNEQEKERMSRLFKVLNIEESNLMVDETALLRELVEEYSDIFALDSTELGTTELVTHSIDTGDSHPIRQPLRRIPFALQRTMEEMVQKMLAQGVIQNSNSSWTSPVVLIKKKDGSHHFCVDYRRLNGLTKMDVFPLPRVDDTLDMLSQTQYFSMLDLAAGYWQVRMDSDSQEKTAFSTCSGHYEFCVMPFGLCNGPSTFQRLMESVLMGLSRSRCMVYLDDVMVIGRNFTEHLENLREVFGRFRQANLKLKPEKCFLASSEVLYLGYVVSREGISADVQKVEAVRSFPRPTNLTSLRSFLGLASYYRRFIPNFSTVASPLYALTRKDAEFFWGQSEQVAFDHLKQILIDAPVLAFPNFDQEFILETDASGVGLGAILAQKQPDGTVQPIAYGSRTLQQQEKKYGATELEALGVVWAVKHFRHYIYGHHCHVFTNHEPLRSLLNTPHPSGKLARWGLALQEVDIVIHYRPGKSNVSADSLSRYPVAQSSKYDVCAENSPVAAIISKEGIDKEGESSSSLSPRPSKVEKLRNKGTEECCVAAVSPELWKRQGEKKYGR